MSPDFVRYSPEIETFDPKLSKYMTRILDYWQTKVRESPAKEAQTPPPPAWRRPGPPAAWPVGLR